MFCWMRLEANSLHGPGPLRLALESELAALANAVADRSCQLFALIVAEVEA